MTTPTEPLTRLALAARLESGQSVEVPTQGTSMTPFLHAGDRVRIVAVDPGRLRLGDVIAFWRGPDLVVHRFAGWAGPGLLREKGDGQRACAQVPEADLLGRVDLVRRGGVDQPLDPPSARMRNRLLGLRARCFCLLFPPARRVYHWFRRTP